MSTRSTASRRPENSSQVATSLGTTVATDTGVAAGATGVGALFVRMLKTAVPTAATAVSTVPAIQRPRELPWVFEFMSKSFRELFAKASAAARLHLGRTARQAKYTWRWGALFRSERYDIWHNVAISQEAVKAF